MIDFVVRKYHFRNGWEIRHRRKNILNTIGELVEG